MLVNAKFYLDKCDAECILLGQSRRSAESWLGLRILVQTHFPDPGQRPLAKLHRWKDFNQIDPEVLGRIGDSTDSEGSVSKADLLQVFFNWNSDQAICMTFLGIFRRCTSVLLSVQKLTLIKKIMHGVLILEKYFLKKIPQATRNSSLWRDCLDARSTAKVCFYWEKNLQSKFFIAWKTPRYVFLLE